MKWRKDSKITIQNRKEMCHGKSTNDTKKTKETQNNLSWFQNFAVRSTLFIPPSGSNDRGHIVFVLSVCLLFVCLSVCLSVVNFNLRYNFWTVRDRDFIFGMHTPLMKPFQMTPRSMNLWPWLDLEAKNSFLDFVAARGTVFHKHALIFKLYLCSGTDRWKLG